MSERRIIIVKNYQTSDIMIEDLGITVSAGAVINFTDVFEIYIILASIDLYTYVSNGDLVINDGTEDLDIEVAKDFITINTIGDEELISNDNYFSNQIYSDDINSGWFDTWPDGRESGSDGGWAQDINKSPMIMPFDCKLSHIDIFLKSAEYVNRGTSPGNLYFDLSLWDHEYNTSNKKITYRFTLPGSFTGDKIDNQTFAFVEPSFTIIDGTENIYKPALLGTQFEINSGQIGQVTKFRDVFIRMTFQRIN